MTRKFEMHVPVEMYGFIGVSLEGTAAEAVAAYREVTDLVRQQDTSLPDKEFRELFEKIVKGIPVNGDPGVMEQLNPQQRFAIGEARKLNNRNK